MIETWKIIDSGSLSAETIMAKDAELLATLLPNSNPILHLYEWQNPSLTYGHFIRPEDYLKLDALKENNLIIARRPTGGGMIFHLTDFAFSIVVPSTHLLFSQNTLKNYATINHWLIQVIKRWKTAALPMQLYQNESISCEKPSFCMVKPTCFDVVMEGKKIAGAAIRKTRQGFLYQGSLSLSPAPLKILKNVLKEPESVINAMQLQSFYLIGPSEVSISHLNEKRNDLKEILKQNFSAFYLK